MIYLTEIGDIKGLEGVESPEYFKQTFDYKKLKVPPGYSGPYPLKAGEYYRFFIDFGNIKNFDPNVLNVNFGKDFYNFIYNKEKKRISFTVKDATHYGSASFWGKDIVLLNSNLVRSFVNTFHYYNKDFYEKNLNSTRSYFAKDRDSNVYADPWEKTKDIINDPDKELIPTWLKWSIGFGIVAGISIPLISFSLKYIKKEEK